MSSSNEALKNKYVNHLLDEETNPGEAPRLENLEPITEKQEYMADLYIGKVAGIRQEIDRIKKLQADMIEFYNFLVEKEEKKISYFSFHLQNFMQGILDATGKCSRSYPSGAIKFGPEGKSVQIPDDIKPTEYQYLDYVNEKVVFMWNKKGITDHWKKTGELPEFATIEVTPRKFFINTIREEIKNGTE